MKFINDVSRFSRKVGFKLKKRSPEVLVVAGVVGVVTSGVMACRATTKASAIMDQTKSDITDVHHLLEHPEQYTETYTQEDSKKDLTIIYAQTGLKLAKLYAPAVILGALSITSIVASNNILRKRNVALAAAYATVDKGFKEYRGRVVERFGKQLDRELRFNIKSKEIEETIIDEKGKEKTVNQIVNTVDPSDISGYARFFDECCAGWSRDAEYNLMLLNQQQNYANELLKTKGYLFLNDVYESLGMPRTKAGQVVGWIYDERTPNGDNFVDFGIYNIHNDRAIDFVNGREKSILLDFNVDGVILDRI